MLDDFLVRALLAGVGLALVTGPAVCYFGLRRLAPPGVLWRDDCPLALLGVAFAILTDLHLAIGIFATASVVVAVMFHLERRDTLPTDSLLGLLAHGGLALGLVTLSFFPNMRLDLAALLFGDILAVSRLDLALIWAGGAVALGVLAWLWRPLLAATVRRFATSPEKMAVGAALAGVVAVVGGLLASANWDTPSGPSIVVAALVLFVVTRVGRPRRRATAP